MKFEYFFLCVVLTGFDAIASVTFLNATDATLTLRFRYPGLQTGPYHVQRLFKDYTVEANKTLVENFSDNKLFRFNAYTHRLGDKLSEPSGEYGFWADPGNQYLTLIKNPKINLTVPITYDKQEDKLIFHFPSDLAALKKVLSEPIEAHRKTVIEATTPKLPAGVGNIVREYAMPEEMYQTSEGLKEAAACKEKE